MRVQTTDPIQPGLGIRHGEDRNSWLMRVRSKGKQVQLFVGHDDTMPIELAREIVRRGIADAQAGLPVDKAWVLRIREEYADRLVQPATRTRPVPWTWSDALDAYLEDLAERGRSPATILGYRTALRVIEGLDDRRVKDVSIEDVKAALAEVAKDRPSATFRGTEIVRTWWRWLVSESVREMSGVTEDVLAGLKPPPGATRSKGKRVVSTPEIEAVARVVDYCRHAERAHSVASALEVACLTGVRLAQICAARNEDIRQGWWFVPGNLRSGEYCIPLTPRLRILMETNTSWCFEEVYTGFEERDHVSEVTVATHLRGIGDFVPSALVLAITESLRKAGFGDEKIRILHRRASDDPLSEIKAAGYRGDMIVAWQKIVEAAI